MENFMYFTVKKIYISCQFCFYFFLGNIYKFCYEKKNYRKLLPIFLENILCKTLFVTNFVKNNYSQKNYLLIKILRKNSIKKYFLANFFNKFTRKFSCNIRIFSSVLILILTCKHVIL